MLGLEVEELQGEREDICHHCLGVERPVRNRKFLQGKKRAEEGRKVPGRHRIGASSCGRPDTRAGTGPLGEALRGSACCNELRKS